jgi:hypothetical protein
MDQWEKNYYITAVAGSSNGSSLVVMSKGLYFAQVIFEDQFLDPYKQTTNITGLFTNLFMCTK